MALTNRRISLGNQPSSWATWAKSIQDAGGIDKYKKKYGTDPLTLGSITSKFLLPAAGILAAGGAFSGGGAGAAKATPAIGGGTTAAGSSVVGSSLLSPAAETAASGGGGLLGGVGDWIGKTFSSANLLKFANSPTGKTLLTNYLLPQLLPNPDTGSIQRMMEQAAKSRQAALDSLNFAPYTSGGDASRVATNLAGRGIANGTMGQVSSALLDNQRARAMQDYNLRKAGMTGDIEGGYLRDLMMIYGQANESNRAYYDRLASLTASLAELFG